MTRSAKHWCFTLNNYTDAEKQQLADKASELVESAKLVYAIFGAEVGDSGTPHLQGFLSFAKRTTMGGVKKLVSRRAHCEQARGTPAQAADYCKKDGSYQEFGRCPSGSGSRNDLVALYELIKQGKSEKEIADTFPGQYIRYSQGIQRAMRLQLGYRTWMPETFVRWGKSNRNKTRYVYDTHGYDNVYKHTGESWFDGYTGQSVALFDDFHGGVFKLTYLLKLLDRYPMLVPVKGGYVQWIPKTIYITANSDPKYWYLNALPEHLVALWRRIKSIEEFE